MVITSVTLVAGTTGTALAAENPDPGLISVYDPCEPDTGVTVIVDFQSLGNHDVQIRCALGEQANGGEALVNAGFPIDVVTSSPGFICRIGGYPTASETNCARVPGGDQYWSYWHGQPGGRWSYSGVGAFSYKPKVGSVEGWAFSRKVSDDALAFRVQPQDSRGATFVLPDTYPSSAGQVAEAQRWLAERAPGVADGSVKVNGDRQGLLVLADMVDGLARSGYDMSSPGLDSVRDLFADAATARGFVFSGGSGGATNPWPERIAAWAIALSELSGGPAVLNDGTDMRQMLVDQIVPGTASVKRASGTTNLLSYIEPVVEALARTGPVPPEVLPLIEAIKAAPTTIAHWDQSTPTAQGMISSLVAVRAAGGTGLDDAIEQAADVIENLQAADGSIPAGGETQLYPTIVEETAQASVALALAGRGDSAEQAARYVSRFQITAEVAGGGPDAEFPGPASADVGAFASNTDMLRDAVTYGTTQATKAPETTPYAVMALALAPWEDPIAPTLLTTLPTGLSKTGVTVTGSINPGSSAQQIHVEYGTTTAYGQRVDGPSVPAYAETSWFELPITGLTPETTYHYRLVATDDSGQLTYGEDQSFTTLPDDLAPAITTDVANVSAVEGSDATFTVAATGKPTPTVTWQRQVSGTWQDIVSDPQAVTTDTSLTLKEVTLSQSGQRYRARVANRAGSAFSRAATLTVTQATAPATPAKPTLALDGKNATVSWTAPSDGGSAITGYTVTLTPATGTALTKNAAAGTTSVMFENLSAGTYTATVVAKNSVGSSAASPASASVTVPADPAPVVGTSVTASVGSVVYGKAGKVTVTVTAASGGVKPTGSVSTKVGGKTITGTLSNGTATLTLPAKSLKPGTSKITVTYAGASGKFTGSSKSVSVKVAKAKPTVKVKGPKKVKRGKTATYTVTVTAPSGIKPTGKVTVKVAGVKKTVKLNAKGKATVKIKIAKKTKPSKQTVTVTYAGNTYLTTGKAKTTKTTITK